jgi:hypothetical protein
MIARTLKSVALCVAIASCTRDDTEHAVRDSGVRTDSVAPSSAATVLIDSTILPATAGEGGWNYHQTVARDLNGDGSAERVVITARVEMIRGQPVWDDGQPWQVYIVDQSGTRTNIYSRRLQLGTLTMRVSRPDANGKSTVVLLEQLPDRLSVYEATYLGPAQAQIAVLLERALDATGDTSSR